jgi:hypothetical protein
MLASSSALSFRHEIWLRWVYPRRSEPLRHWSRRQLAAGWQGGDGWSRSEVVPTVAADRPLTQVTKAALTYALLKGRAWHGRGGQR